VSCLEADNGPLGGKSALCFDNSNGTLVVEVTPFRTATRIADKTCYLADYQKFGDRLFARSYECDEDRRPRLEANVVELVAEPAPDPALFAPLEGAKELVNCLTVIKPPRAVRQAEPIGPGPGHGPVLVVMSVVVGVDGKPHDVRVTSDPQPDFDRASLKAVRQWTFNPATCNGEPIETEIAIETSFVSF
jgi:TonB family protein